MSVAIFDELYAANSDPWGTETRWYEVRKRSVLLASLLQRRYGRGCEVGCGNGQLAQALAERCAEFVGCDVSAEAIRLASQRLAACRSVTVEKRELPQEWPDGRFDLIVLSEVLYFLDRDSIVATAKQVRDRLTPQGEVVACNWRPDIEGYGQSGEAAHRLFACSIGLPCRFNCVEDNFILSLWTAAPTLASDE